MKKTLMFLSAVALAANVYAADKLEAGTADAPNYYVLKAGRGTPYLAYVDGEPLTTASGAETLLHRTNDLTAANIWAVTPGTEEGTLNIVAYGNSRGLMNFINAEGSYSGSGAVATCVKPKDIYPIYQANGTVSLAINTAAGKATVGETTEYYTLDASNGSDFCGNWVPNDAGTNWSAFQLDMTNGVEAALAAVETAIYAAGLQAVVTTYSNSFTDYMNAVPWVADILQQGIEALNAIEPTAEYQANADAVWAKYTSDASAELNTMFAGKEIAVKNLRRANGGKTAYPSADATSQTFPMVASFTTNDDAVFTLEAAEEGYYFYSATQNVFLAHDSTNGSIITTADKANAQAVKFMLNAHSGFVGVNMLLPGVDGAYALNADQNASTKLVTWYPADGGSIWSIMGASDEDKAKEAIDANVALLEPYVANVPDMVANILTAAIEQIKALTYSETIATEAEAIATKAIADANELLAGGMNGIELTLLNLRQNKFVSVADNEWVYNPYNEAPETVFTFKAQEDGGYILHNEAAGVYFGEAEKEESGQTNVTVATEESASLVVYPFLCKGGAFAGVALALEANPTSATVAINTNANAKILHTYSAGDAGSIFALKAPNTVLDPNAIEEVKAAAKLQGIYDLQGRKLAAPVKGINIINGVKVLVK